METKINNTHGARSVEMEQIIGRAPVWIVRWGIIVIGFILMLILAGASVIKYPEIISAPVVISTDNPTVKIIAQSTGRITELHFKDGEMVNAGSVVAVIENAAITKDVMCLKKIVIEVDTGLDIRRTVGEMKLPLNLQVGEIQADYAGLAQAISNWNFIISNKYYQNKTQALRRQQQFNRNLQSTIEHRGELLDHLLALETTKDSANKYLRNEKVIAPLEYNEIQKGTISRELNINDNQTAKYQNGLQKIEYEKGLFDIEQQYKEEENNTIMQVRDVAKKIKGMIAVWEKQYLLQAPVDGKITFFQLWKENQYVTTNSQVFALLPQETSALEIRATLPLYRAGKVREGQLAYIKLQQYPYQEYGMIRARIKMINNTPSDGNYIVRLALEKDLISTLNKPITPAPEMNGTIDIITADKSILQRIFEKVYGKLH